MKSKTSQRIGLGEELRIRVCQKLQQMDQHFVHAYAELYKAQQIRGWIEQIVMDATTLAPVRRMTPRSRRARRRRR